jgi:hypothetical protein
LRGRCDGERRNGQRGEQESTRGVAASGDQFLESAVNAASQDAQATMT